MIDKLKLSFFILACMLVFNAGAQEPASAESVFMQDCRALTAGAHRLTGSDEYRKAAEYVEKRLRDSAQGKEVEVLIQEFQTVRLSTKRCELLPAAGEAIPLHPMRPNGIMPPVTPPEGIKGTLVYAKGGDLNSYDGRLGEDPIVVLDYNSREAWIQAFRLGARAVIFVRDGKLKSDTFHYSQASANLPRYFYDGPASELPLGQIVTLHSLVKWEPALGRNVLALIKGKPVKDPNDPNKTLDATFSSSRGEESILFAADLDSYGEVPDLSKGARGSANCAGLLKMADALMADPPRRNTVIAFFDGRWNGHKGSSAFYKWLDHKKGDKIYEESKEALELETDYLNKLLALANQDEPLADKGANIRFYFLDDLKRLADNYVFDIKDQLTEMRWEKRKLEMKIQALRLDLAKRQKVAADEKTDEARADADAFMKMVEEKEAEYGVRINELEDQIAKLDATKDPWNNLRRALNNEKKNKGGSISDIKAYLAKEADNLPGWETKLVSLHTAEMGKVEEEIKATEAEFDTLTDKINRMPATVEVIVEGVKQLEANPERTKLGESRDDVAAKLKDLKNKLENITKPDYRDLSEKITETKEKLEVMKGFDIVVQDEVRLKNTRLAEIKRLTEFFKVNETLYNHFKSTKESSKWFGMHISMMFGDSSPRWGLVIGGNSPYRSTEDKSGLYNRIQAGFREVAQSLQEAGTVTSFETKTADLTLSPPEVVWSAPKLAHSGDIAGRLGYYNFAFGTMQEALPFEGTPDDTLENLNSGRIEGFFDEAIAMSRKAADSESLSLDRVIKWNAGYLYTKFEDKPKGAFVMAAKGSSIPNDPTPGAIVQMFFQYTGMRNFSREKIYGMNSYQTLISDQNALISYGPANQNLRHQGMCLVFDNDGLPKQASSSLNFNKIDKRLDVRDCMPGVMVLPPMQINSPATLNETQIMDGNTDSPIDPTKSFGGTSDGLVYWYAERRARVMKVFRKDSICILKSGPPALEQFTEAQLKNMDEQEKIERIKGRGISIEEKESVSVTGQSAADMWRLNNSRLNTLYQRGVKDSSISELHGRAEDLLLEAQAADSELEAQSKAAASFHIQREVYSKLRAMFDDLVYAVLILLALCIPFAFAAERLLIGSTNIYRQILWFAGMFVLTFILLFNTHPAFAISNAPLIIFLGFTILVLSGMVIWIIMRKFEVELKVLQGMETTVHAADISRFSTIVAAMNMGISSMRRRPLRTTLTAVTIILLTFTILCFASFGTETGIIRIFSQPAPEYTAVFVRDYNWTELSDDLMDVIKGRWGKSSTICRRYWVCPGSGPGNVPGILISRGDASNPLVMKGILGLDFDEIKERQVLATMLKADAETFDNMVWITQSAASFMDVKEGDKILLKGHELVVGPILDEVKLSVIRDMDDSSILPVDFEDDSSNQQQSAADTESGTVEQKSWKTIGVDSCAIVSSKTALAMDARLRALLVYTKGTKEAAAIAEEIARFMPTPIAATLQDAVYLHILGAKISASGVKDLFFPILLGGLVIFGTMLGSVADREKEVYTFSALGLAPPHVAGLFFAEALVYSVVGGLSGYLLAQMLMKILDFLASKGLVTVPEMNYSSTNAIITILLVMVTVLISALYPAYKASKSANPGVMRNWKVPMPEGDILDLVFPFTVSQYDITGVVSFLREHFDAYSDTGLGTFMSQNTKLVKNDEGELQLECKLALAPFDLGVTQYFELKSVPSEIEGIDEVAIRLTRMSGQPKDWYRLNKVLLDDLRKQFLIWRSIPHETMELYRERTLIELGEKEPHSTDTSTDSNAQGAMA